MFEEYFPYSVILNIVFGFMLLFIYLFAGEITLTWIWAWLWTHESLPIITQAGLN
jgi:hypothetical protein